MVFVTESRETVYGFSDLANKHAMEALDGGKIGIAVIAFPANWSNIDEWYNVKTTISHHVDYMNISRGNKIVAFGNSERGISFDTLLALKEKGIGFAINQSDIPDGFNLVLLCEFHPEWAGLKPIDPKEHLDSLFKTTFGL